MFARSLRPAARAVRSVTPRASLRFASTARPSASSGSGSSHGREDGKTLAFTVAAVAALVTAGSAALDRRAKHVHPSEPKEEEEVEEPEAEESEAEAAEEVKEVKEDESVLDKVEEFVSEAEAALAELVNEAEVALGMREAAPSSAQDALAAEAASQGAFNEETGEINWDCPCLGGMATGPCGEEFKAAFSCFVYSEAEPKGIDCVEKFKAMQDCFREHPDVYGEEDIDEDDAAPAPAEDKSEEK